jgi:hypothetical protein
MPLGSSSDAPVVSPGPSTRTALTIDDRRVPLFRLAPDELLRFTGGQSGAEGLSSRARCRPIGLAVFPTTS